LERTEHWSADEVKLQLDDSLRALGTDHVELYQFHSGGNAVFDNAALWEMLAREKERGRVRHLGISISGDAAQQQYQAARAFAVGAEVIQVVYNRLNRAPEDRVLPICHDQELGVLARVPLASGFLSGKYSQGASFGPEDVRASRTAEERERLIAEAQRIRAHEAPAGLSLSAWALAWCLGHRVVSAVIPGCKSPEQVRANAQAAEIDLPARA
jgi:aryl-alcohol dehydrogenase-like predicted oxidoreductase